MSTHIKGLLAELDIQIARAERTRQASESSVVYFRKELEGAEEDLYNAKRYLNTLREARGLLIEAEGRLYD